MNESPPPPASTGKLAASQKVAPVSVSQELRIGTFIIKPHTTVAHVVLAIISTIVVVFMVYKMVITVRSAIAGTANFRDTVCVFVPDSTRSTDGAFYQDGAVQTKGFEKALQDAECVPDHLEVVFERMRRDDTPDSIIERMRARYESDHALFFVITMSSKVVALRDHFEKWRATCIREKKRPPVLIATVASAPGIADVAHGVLRWYIRSEEESSLLAEFLRWRMGVEHVGIFYITRTPGQADDQYGSSGMQAFRDRFLYSLGGKSAEEFSTTAATAREVVSGFMRGPLLERGKNGNDVGVFIVGYGEMVKEVLDALLSMKFQGPIVCASTLTEPEWQPKDLSADGRIFTVLPRTADPLVKLQKADRNVVFYFAKETLGLVLKLTADDPPPDIFLERWKKSADKSDLKQQCMEDGDIAVQLDVVGSDGWRWPGH